MGMRDFQCEAYAPEPIPDCFFEAQGRCQNQLHCHARMNQERKRVYRRISELAAAGDQTMAFLLSTINGPDDLLNGSE
jgi:hypothetical protein